MEALVVVIIPIVALFVLDVASLRYGADSRPTLTDDHAR